MNDFFENMLNGLESTTPILKSNYHLALHILNNSITQYFKDIDYTYDPSAERVSLFNIDTNERLKQARKELEYIKTHRHIAVPNFMLKIDKKLRNFINCYHIGFISEAKMDNNSTIIVELKCLITSSGDDKNKISRKEYYKKQIETLKDLGFEFFEEKDFKSPRIKDNEKNKELIHKLLNKLNAWAIYFEIRSSKNGDYISKIDFRAKPEDIMAFNESNDFEEAKKSDIMNKDEIALAKKTISDIQFAISSINYSPKLKQTCCNLIESYMKNLAEIFNCNDLSIAEEYNRRYTEERQKNIEINNIKKEISEILEANEVKKLNEEIFIKINKYLLKNMLMYVSDYSITQYGIINITIKTASPYSLDLYEDLESEIMSEEDFCSLFETNNLPYEDGELKILAIDSNIEKIEKIINNLGDTIINSINIEYSREGKIISNISFIISTLTKLYE